MELSRPSSGSVIIADDDPSILLLLRHILVEDNYDVTEARSGREAIELCREHEYDLALFDLVMPDIDGISLLKEWSSAGVLESQVVIMSGHGTVDTAVEATRLGAHDFVEKPLSKERLLVAIRNALELRSLGREVRKLRDGQTRSFSWLRSKTTWSVSAGWWTVCRWVLNWRRPGSRCSPALRSPAKSSAGMVHSGLAPTVISDIERV